MIHLLFALISACSSQALIPDTASDKVAFIESAQTLPDFFHVPATEIQAGLVAMQTDLKILQAQNPLTPLEQQRIATDILVPQIVAITQKPKLIADDAVKLFALEQQFCKISGQRETQFPFTESEYLALCFYTGDDYKPINAALHAHQPRTLATTIAVLDRALAKLPDFTGDVRSGRTVPDETLKNFAPGQVIQIDSYLSTSSSAPWAGNLQLLIHPKSGKDIHAFSRVPDEHEVLMPRGSRFKIESVTQMQNGATLVMQQL